MIENIHEYFRAEKSESLLFMIIALIAFAVAVYGIFVIKSSFYKGLAIPLILIGVIQIAVGGTVYFRTDRQEETLVEQYQTDPAQYVQEELPRMQKVNKNFDLYKIIEIVLLVTGIGLVLIFRTGKTFWLGVGVGLAIQSLTMLTLDIFAERRADRYTAQIENLRVNG